MNNNIIINLFGGPGAGKTTTSAGLFYKMKLNHLNVELTGEYAKDLVYEQRQNILKTDQLFILGQQNRRIKRLLDVTNYIISDSPLILSSIYYDKEKNMYNEALFKSFVIDTFNKYNNINFYLKRNKNLEYKEKEGRNQTLDQAKSVDSKVLSTLKFFNIPFIEIEVDDEKTVNEIYDHVINKNKREYT